MKSLILLSAAFFLSAFSVFSQFSVSLQGASYLTALNEEEVPEFEAIELEPSFGVNLGVGLSGKENSSFSLFYSYSKSKIEMEEYILYEESGELHTESLGIDEIQTKMSKFGFENLWYSKHTAFYGGYGAFLSWFSVDEQDESFKGYGSFAKIGFGEKNNSLFIEAGLELSSVGSEFFSTPKGEIRLQTHNLFVGVGYRF